MLNGSKEPKQLKEICIKTNIIYVGIHTYILKNFKNKGLIVKHLIFILYVTKHSRAFQHTEMRQI